MESFKGQKKLKIDLGAGDPRDGESSPEGYLKQDADSEIPGIDIYCDIRHLLREIDEGSCEKIRASHVIEHFPQKETVSILKIIFDALEPGGEAEIIVPNFKWHAQICLAGDEEKAVYYAFGGQLDEYDFHYTGFTPRLLWKALKEAGFGEVKVNDESSITAIAKKV